MTTDASDLVHEVHVSELRSYRGCRRRWSWLYERNLQPVVTPTPLEFGVAFHRALEVMFDPKTWHLDKYALGVRAETAFIEKCKEQRREFIRVTGKYGLSDEEEKDYETSLNLGIGMIRNFAKTFLMQNEYTPVAVEHKFRVPLRQEETGYLRCVCERCQDKWTGAGKSLREFEGLPVVYEGRVDAILRDRFGGYWIVDWKTTMRMMNEDSDVVLETDDQVASYSWAFRVSMGLNIRGFLYVEIKKGFPEEPEQMKVVRLGRKFSVSKNLNTDLETYRAAVMKGDADAYQAGLYNEFLAWLKTDGPRFIQVNKQYRGPQTLENIGYYIYLQAQEMTKGPAVYPSPGRFTCTWCKFQGPCIDATAGRDYEYALNTMYEVKPRYYELAEPSTDRRY